MDAQAPQVGDVGERVAEFGELCRRQRKRVAAGQDHLVDGIVRAHLRDRFAPAVGSGGLLRVGEMTAETVTTVHGAGASGNQQRTTNVFLQHALSGPGCGVPDGVANETRHVSQFLRPGENLEQQRVERIARAHACGKPTRDAHRETGVSRRQQFRGQMLELQQTQQFMRIGDRLAPELLPASRDAARWR